MNAERVALKTMGIKSRVYNQIRTDLYNKLLEDDGTPSYKVWRDFMVKTKGATVLTDKEKIELFDKWFALNKEAHQELNNYKSKRQYKAYIHKLREERKIKEASV